MRRALVLGLLAVLPFAGCAHGAKPAPETAVEVHGRILTERTEQFEGGERPAPGASDPAHGSCAGHARPTTGEQGDGDAQRPHDHDGCRCGDAERK